ncbi:MAG TPA: sigma-70 family RNA polymerase sigma factor [Bacteroidales bacterium]|nr:sigma-70 family RNA polymerase sigma factor [Bacteroidales bacterium]HPR58380.1 sigma-70 family RNA polymerase sigma factor [Bacteroidales bacterium]HRW96657.1 sigma-70 family RNA polymerase sigma factor [Bacteroidales bacterium]
MTVQDYNRCVDNFSDGIYRFMLKNTRDEELSKDVVQEAFCRLWEKHEGVEFEKARSYLFTTAYHFMIDEFRKNKYKTDMSDFTSDTLKNETLFTDLADVLEEAVSKLPEIQRSVVLLRDYEGYSYKEIGDITGLSESQVKVYIYRARMTLKQYIGSMDKVI